MLLHFRSEKTPPFFWRGLVRIIIFFCVIIIIFIIILCYPPLWPPIGEDTPDGRNSSGPYPSSPSCSRKSPSPAPQPPPAATAPGPSSPSPRSDFTVLLRGGLFDLRGSATKFFGPNYAMSNFPPPRSVLLSPGGNCSLNNLEKCLWTLRTGRRCYSIGGFSGFYAPFSFRKIRFKIFHVFLWWVVFQFVIPLTPLPIHNWTLASQRKAETNPEKWPPPGPKDQRGAP